MWHLTCDTWQITPDTWHMTPDKWQFFFKWCHCYYQHTSRDSVGGIFFHILPTMLVLLILFTKEKKELHKFYLKLSSELSCFNIFVCFTSFLISNSFKIHGKLYKSCGQTKKHTRTILFFVFIRSLSGWPLLPPPQIAILWYCSKLCLTNYMSNETRWVPDDSRASSKLFLV